MKSKTAVGIDIGFRKTGFTVFSLTKTGDEIVYAETMESNPPPSGSAIYKDVQSIFNMLTGLDDLLKQHKPDGLFIELPHGGAQSSRAARCMGIATAVAVSLTHYNNNAFEMYSPLEIAHGLGLDISAGEATKLGLTKAARQAWKKQRIEDLVRREWPFFDGWPKRKATAEDSYDSAAAFMYGRNRNELYKRLKESL